MKVLSRVLWCTLVLMFMLGAGSLTAEDFVNLDWETDDFATKFNVAEIISDEVGNGTVHLTALDANKEIVAIAEVVLSGISRMATSTTIWTDDATLELHWFAQTGQVIISDLQGHISGSIRLSLLGGEPDWVREAAVEEILARHNHSAMLGAALLSYSEKKWDGTTHDNPGGGVGGLGSMGGTEISTCTGRTFRGFGMDSARSMCCAEAADDVNTQCTNQWCYNCCWFWACDAWCALGDYFCFCGKTGRACDEADVPD